MRTVVVGTRQSSLALTQTNQVIDQLKKICEISGLQFDFKIKKIVTRGDRILDVTLSKVGGKALFVKEIEQAMLDGEIDLAVHSMKDLPTELPEGLVIGAIPERKDARDCLISINGKLLSELPLGAVVGTSSLRRASQLKHYRPDLKIEPIRGNIDSRLHKLETENFDAIILAVAGLERIGWEQRISEHLSKDICLPSVGQGALGIECRVDDEAMLHLLDKLNDPRSALAVRAERSFLGRIEGGCQVPVGAHAILEEIEQPDTNNGSDALLISLTGMVGSPDGNEMIKESIRGTDPQLLGHTLADRLVALGADRILAKVRG